MKSKLNVIFFCPSIEEGGVEKNLVNTVNGLKDNFNISLITANFNKKKFFKKKINFISPGNNFFNKKKRIIKSLVCIYLFLKNFLFAKIIIISFQANTLAILLGKLFFKKVIIRSNTSPNTYAKNKFKRIVMKFFFKLSNEVLVNSYHFKREFIKYFSVYPIVIYNSIGPKNYLLKKFNKKINFNFFDKSKKSLKILSIGRLVHQKDHITILRALKLVKQKRKVKFCLIGKGDLEKKIKSYIKNNNLSNYIKLLGYKDNIYPYLKKSDLFILSSLYEGSPNTLIEALTFGLKIISTNCKTGPKEILKKEKFGKLFKVGDYKQLSKLIINTKKNTKKKVIFDSRFDYENMLNKYRSIILKL